MMNVHLELPIGLRLEVNAIGNLFNYSIIQ